jgi:hypothetical protein
MKHQNGIFIHPGANLFKRVAIMERRAVTQSGLTSAAKVGDVVCGKLEPCQSLP